MLLGDALATDRAARILPYFAALALFAGARTLASREARLRYVALCTAAPLITVYAAESRAYALLALEGLALFLLSRRDSENARSFALLSAAGAAALYTHYLAIFLVAALTLLCLATGRRRSAAALGVSAALFLPWVPTLLRQPAAATLWMREPAGRSAAGFLSSLGGVGRVPDPLGGPLPAWLLLAGSALGAVLVVSVLGPARRDPEAFRAALLAAGTLGLILLAGAIRPVGFAGRSEMVVLPVWLWAIAKAGDSSRVARAGAWAAIALGVAGNLLLVRLVTAPWPPPSTAAAAAWVARAARKGDVVVAGFPFYLPARLEADRGELPASLVAVPPELAAHPGWSVPEAAEAEQRELLAALVQVAGARAAGGRVFFLLQPLQATPAFIAQLAARGRAREILKHPQAVVILWEAGGAASP